MVGFHISTFFLVFQVSIKGGKGIFSLKSQKLNLFLKRKKEEMIIFLNLHS